MNKLADLIEKINSFDNYYEMSDSYKVISKWTDKEAIIKRELKGLSEEDKQEIQTNLTEHGKTAWERYFSV